MPATTAAQESLTLPSFELSTKDFESAFIFNATLPRVYDEDESSLGSPVSPRSSWSEGDRSPILSSPSLSLPLSGRSSFVSASADSSTGELRRPSGDSADAFPPFPELRGDGDDTRSSLVPTQQISQVLDTLPRTPSPPPRRRPHLPLTVNTVGTNNDCVAQPEPSPPALPRYFSISASSTSPTPSRRRATTAGFTPTRTITTIPTRTSASDDLTRRLSTQAQVQVHRHKRSRSIASSPWTCLEDAHHPLCNGQCSTEHLDWVTNRPSSDDSSSRGSTSLSSPTHSTPPSASSSSSSSGNLANPCLNMAPAPLRPHRNASLGLNLSTFESPTNSHGDGDRTGTPLHEYGDLAALLEPCVTASASAPAPAQVPAPAPAQPAPPNRPTHRRSTTTVSISSSSPSDRTPLMLQMIAAQSSTSSSERQRKASASVSGGCTGTHDEDTLQQLQQARAPLVPAKSGRRRGASLMGLGASAMLVG